MRLVGWISKTPFSLRRCPATILTNFTQSSYLRLGSESGKVPAGWAEIRPTGLTKGVAHVRGGCSPLAVSEQLQCREIPPITQFGRLRTEPIYVPVV